MKGNIFFVITFLFWAVLQISANDAPIVDYPLGMVKGSYKTSYKGRTYEAYEGIPYALPPMGSRRFEPPHPIVKRVHNLHTATRNPTRCIQFDYQYRKISGVEDCLYLSIYTPSSNNSSPLPVILWFHEGAFQRGWGSYTKARYIMDRDVILVTMNYRLGIFGFLSTEDEVVPGNMGLKDQNMALHWLVDNVASFGGDPKKISLVGVSAGGSSVHFHYLSKMSRGLFRNGISFSGTALSPWAYDVRPLETTRKVAALAGCEFDRTIDIVQCLRNLPAEMLSNATGAYLKQLTNQYFYFPLFIPVAEKNVDNYFINRSPEEILNSGDINDVPWTTGIVSEEGGSTVSGLAHNREKLSYIDENWNELTPYILMYNKTKPVSQHTKIAEAVRKHYIGDQPLGTDAKTTWGLIYMKTHESFTIVAEKSARLQAAAGKSPVYAYYYTYRALQSHSDLLSDSTENFGVCHLDDILLILENDYIDPTKTDSDKEMLDVMLDFWYSAVTTGKPDLKVDWPNVDPNSKNFTYMHIVGPRNNVVKRSSDWGEKRFWSNLDFN